MHVVGLVRLGIPNDELVTLIGALGVGILVFLRQWIAIRHTRSRVEQQRLELISSVSHEIRTPLTGLVGYLELLADPSIGLGPEERQDMLRIASAEAAQLGRIITDMIAMARNDGHGLAVSPGPTDPEDVCEAALDAAHRSRVTVSVQYPEAIQVDRDRLVQALANLVANADKYGNERIHVAAGRIGDAMVLEVHDDGPGVPVRYQERIFEQFERGAHRYNAGVPGMGVGLAIVRAIARAHGGDVDYRPSELLGGACFSISVPTTPSTSIAQDLADATLQALAS
jgi:signal transduction histidine kinase